MTTGTVPGWDRLRHGGLLLDAQRLGEISDHDIAPLPSFFEKELRKRGAAVLDGGGDVPQFVTLVLQSICGFTNSNGSWQRGSSVSPDWGRAAITGEMVKPRQLWKGHRGGVLPVFVSREKRLGIGRGRKATSQVLQWLRAGDEQLALVTNGRQWRLIFAGLDFDAWCEWDLDLWFEEGELSTQVDALRSLLSPTLWTPEEESTTRAPLLQAILDSRKGQAELSTILGERVREAVELLVQGHGEALKEQCGDVDPADIYRAAVRIVMRMVVVLFSESRELLPRDNALYHSGYGLNGLLKDLERTGARGGNRLARSWSAWPRMQALFRLIYEGCHHPALLVPSYGGELFAPGDIESSDALTRALAVFETACFEREILPDRDVHRLLERITRTRVKVRQGRTNTWVPAPVDFSDLSSEYIGILYEGLLDFELKTAPAGDPIIFLAIGNQPALPLSRLEGMDDKALKNLLESLLKDKKAKNTGDANDASSDETAEEEDEGEANPDDEPTEDGEGLVDAPSIELDEDDEDEKHSTRTRAEFWARHAVEVGKLAKKPRGKLTPEKQLVFEQTVSKKARQLVDRVILPGEWYLVRWGGTRKGSGTFYTRPGLAVPTVHRTLRPLAWNLPLDESGKPERHADPKQWTPKKPEEILQLKVVDPACGSGTFPVAALRFLTESLYTSLHFHKRFHPEGSQTVVSLFTDPTVEESVSEGSLGQELLPSRPDDPEFEPRLKARLRRHVVERCIYGVDLDPLAVELCRLSLWIETMDRSLPFSFLDHKIKCGNALIGAWFDQFQHYPVMAFKNREGGDKNHNNGVHFEKESRSKALKVFTRLLPESVLDALQGQLRLPSDSSTDTEELHTRTLRAMSQMHDLPVQESAERARIYREEILELQAYQSRKLSLDLWCACWFWPVEKLKDAPLPTNFSKPSRPSLDNSAEVARRMRFFHWELEFPDVFVAQSAGFDAALGNPPWDIAKPSSKEFFSNIDPLYRSYGKQEARKYQTQFFASDEVEQQWLDYNAYFRAQANFFKYCANAFGDPARNEDSKDRFSIVRGKENHSIHTTLRTRRKKSPGFADARHAFCNQGSADLNLYKLFLEQTHALLRKGGRMGFIVPSGLYSDLGTGKLRKLFLERCSWEWLFGFENREKIFDIHRSFKFNSVIIEKDGATDAIQTAFMRRQLEDWEHAERFVTPYSLAQIERFSPKSKAILEIQSERDLEILEKIYANSVLLGDDSPRGWGIKYAREFDMTNDSKLFPPRPKWEEKGYRPDEYSRWLKGDWRPIGELWAELGTKPLPEGERRCAQPPYDTLPIPRADIPAGVVLSREADAWIREEGVEDTALPLYQGAMMNMLRFSSSAWLSGTGLKAKWSAFGNAPAHVSPQFLMAKENAVSSGLGSWDQGVILKTVFRDIARSTDMRTCISATIPPMPCGNVLGVLTSKRGNRPGLSGLLSSLCFDWALRQRIGGTHLNWYVVEELPLVDPHGQIMDRLDQLTARLSGSAVVFAPLGITWRQHCEGEFAWRHNWAITEHERVRLRAAQEAVVVSSFGLELEDLERVVAGCDYPADLLSKEQKSLDAKGFWRVDKSKDPELRHPNLTLIAFLDLQERIAGCGGDQYDGISDFFGQNDGEGWMLPETLRIADYGLGHDDRAQEFQPVASCLGSRFLDWQLAQDSEESWRECHLHARNLLGNGGYTRLLADVEVDGQSGSTDPDSSSSSPSPGDLSESKQGTLFP